MNRILIVEDDPGVFRSLATRLQEYMLFHADCQQSAFEILSKEALDLVLLDLRLPIRPNDMAQDIQVGFDILKRIRRVPILRRTGNEALPVIVMTAFGDEDVSASAFAEYGANDYVKKPFKNLEATIQAVLSGNRAVIPRTAQFASPIHLALNDGRKQIMTNGILWDKSSHYTLLRALADRFLEDRNALKLPKNYQVWYAAELAELWHVTENTVHRRVMRFRRDALQYSGTDGLIDSTRGKSGYRLNPFRVQLISWDEAVNDRR